MNKITWREYQELRRLIIRASNLTIRDRVALSKTAYRMMNRPRY